MKHILITGNGFDLSHNLPTSYNNFIDILKVVEEKEKFTFEEIYRPLYQGKYVEVYKSFTPFNFNDEAIKVLNEKLEDNVWYNYFKVQKQIHTWIDFENSIEFVLKYIFHFTDTIYKELCPDDYFLDVDDVGFYKDFNFKISKNIILERILLDFKIISVFDKGDVNSKEMYLINEEFLIDVDAEKWYRIINVEQLSKFLILQLDNFRNIFNDYFNCFVVPFYDHLPVNELSQFFNKVDYHYTFNYTPTFEKLYSKNITNYVHGRIGESGKQLVLGINEIPENIDTKKYFIPFTKIFQKLHFSTDYTFLEIDFERHNVEEATIYFWGHSLDSSDAEYINEVFQMIKKSKFARKIVIIYRDEGSKGKLLINLIDIVGSELIGELMKKKLLTFEKLTSQELMKMVSKRIPTSSQKAIEAFSKMP